MEDRNRLSQFQIRLQQLLRQHKQMERKKELNIDKFLVLKQKLIKNRQRIESFIQKLKAIGVSDKIIERQIKSLEQAKNRLRIYEQQQKKNNEGLFHYLIRKIKQILKWAIEKIASIISIISTRVADWLIKTTGVANWSIRYILSEKVRQNAKRIDWLKQVIQKKDQIIQTQTSSRQLLIRQIMEFEKNELPKIIAFFKELNG